MKKKLKLYQQGGYNYDTPERDMILANFQGDTFYTQEPAIPRGQNGMEQEGNESAYSGSSANSFLNSLFSKNYMQGYQQGQEQMSQQDQQQAAGKAVEETAEEVTGPDPNENNNILPGTVEGWNRFMSLTDMNGQYETQIKDLRNDMDNLYNAMSSIIDVNYGMEDNADETDQQDESNINWNPNNNQAITNTGKMIPVGYGSVPAGMPANGLELAKGFSIPENSGNMEMVRHFNDERTPIGPFGYLKKGGHLSDYFKGEGYFRGANTERYRMKYKDDATFWEMLQKDKELANEVNNDYGNQILRISGGNPARAAAFNLGGKEGLTAFDERRYEWKPKGDNMSIGEYARRAGYGGFMKQGGGSVPVLNTPNQKYTGLNDPTVGNNAFIPNEGYQVYRGTDDGKPVNLRDVVGNDYTLFGPTDTAWLYGDVYEERVPMGQNNTSMNYAAFLDNKIGAKMTGNTEAEQYLDEQAAAYSKRNIRDALRKRNLSYDDSAINFISAVHGKESTFGTNPLSKIQDHVPFFKSVGDYQINPDAFDPSYLPKGYKPYDFEDQTQAVYNFYNAHHGKMSPEQMYGFYNTGSTKKLSPYNKEFKRIYNLVTDIPND